jgi:hypothetical protein
MAKMGTGMAAPIGCGGHYEPTNAPKLLKGQFEQVGTFTDEGDMTTVTPRGTSVNAKSGKLQNGEYGDK